jgi:hypothetical protein
MRNVTVALFAAALLVAPSAFAHDDGDCPLAADGKQRLCATSAADATKTDGKAVDCDPAQCDVEKSPTRADGAHKCPIAPKTDGE